MSFAIAAKSQFINRAVIGDFSRQGNRSLDGCIFANFQIAVEICTFNCCARAVQRKLFCTRRVQLQRRAVIFPSVAIVNGLAVNGLLLCVFLTGIRHTIRKNQFRVRCHRRCGYRKLQCCPADFVWVQGEASILLQRYTIPICKRIGATAVCNIPVGNAIAHHFERIRVIGYHIHRLAQVDFFSIGGIKKLRSRTCGRQRTTIRNRSTTGRFCYKHTTGDRCTSGFVLDFCLKQATRNACRYSFIAGIAIRHIFLKYAASDCSMIDYTPMSTCKSAAYNSTTVAHIRKGST